MFTSKFAISPILEIGGNLSSYLQAKKREYTEAKQLALYASKLLEKDHKLTTPLEYIYKKQEMRYLIDYITELKDCLFAGALTSQQIEDLFFDHIKDLCVPAHRRIYANQWKQGNEVIEKLINNCIINASHWSQPILKAKYEEIIQIAEKNSPAFERKR